MSNSKRTPCMDDVIADYAHASEEFDESVLQAFVNKYPEYARDLQRYAYIQLTSVPATPQEVANETLSAEEMLPRQSKLLKRMQQLRGSPSALEASEGADKIASISGEHAIRAAAIAVFGSCTHGEDLLLLSVTESASEVRAVPDWFYEGLSIHLGAAPAALMAGMAMKRQRPAGLQMFSAKEKPVKTRSTTWQQAVEECITDDSVKTAILERSKRS
jgi:hypothetical protein